MKKTNWSSGDVITAEKLNHLEGGVEATNASVIPYALMALRYDSQDAPIYYINKTPKDVIDNLYYDYFTQLSCYHIADNEASHTGNTVYMREVLSKTKDLNNIYRLCVGAYIFSLVSENNEWSSILSAVTGDSSNVDPTYWDSAQLTYEPNLYVDEYGQIQLPEQE